MFNNNTNKSNLQKKPNNQVNINNNEYEEEYEFIQVNVATGDQYRKFANIRSKNGQITSEMVNKFHDESTEEAQQWKKNNPGVKSITFRGIQDESGKQVIKVLPTELIFPSGQRVKIYDENGNQIVGEENIRREIEKREANWEQWEKEGKLKVVDHRTHDFDDGSIATVYSRIAPVRLHENETSQMSNYLDHVSKRLKVFSEGSKESGEDNKLVGSSQVKGKIVEVSDDNNMDVDQPEISSTSLTETSFKLSTNNELEKASKDELVDLINRVKSELERRKKEAKESRGRNTVNYEVSTQELRDALSNAESRVNNFQTSGAFTNLNNSNDNKNSSVGGVLAVVGVVGAFAVGGIAFLKSKLGKNKEK